MKAKKKRKPILNTKKLGKRSGRIARKIAGDPKNRERLFAACAEQLAADRDRYFDSFLSSWEQPATGLRETVDALLESGSVKIGSECANLFGMAWDPILAHLFMRLAGTLTEQEKCVFRSRVDRLDGAWRSFGETFAMRHPDMRDAVKRLCETAQDLAAHMAGIFLGEREPKLDDAYARLMEGYTSLVGIIKEGGAQP